MVRTALTALSTLILIVLAVVDFVADKPMHHTFGWLCVALALFVASHLTGVVTVARREV